MNKNNIFFTKKNKLNKLEEFIIIYINDIMISYYLNKEVNIFNLEKKIDEIKYIFKDENYFIFFKRMNNMMSILQKNDNFVDFNEPFEENQILLKSIKQTVFENLEKQSIETNKKYDYFEEYCDIMFCKLINFFIEYILFEKFDTKIMIIEYNNLIYKYNNYKKDINLDCIFKFNAIGILMNLLKIKNCKAQILLPFIDDLKINKNLVLNYKKQL